jgi:hypothetical protein
MMAFALCAAAVPLAHRLLHPRADPPGTLAELADLLRRLEPPLYAVPMTERDPEGGLYLCERPRPREQLQWLRRTSEHRDRWRGVVFCEGNRRLGEVEGSEWQCWDEYGLRIGPFVLFGDPALLRRVRRAIAEP